MVGVEEIDADGVMANPDLALARRRQFDLLDLQNLGTARLMDANRAHAFPHEMPSREIDA